MVTSDQRAHRSVYRRGGAGSPGTVARTAAPPRSLTRAELSPLDSGRCCTTASAPGGRRENCGDSHAWWAVTWPNNAGIALKGCERRVWGGGQAALMSPINQVSVCMKQNRLKVGALPGFCITVITTLNRSRPRCARHLPSLLWLISLHPLFNIVLLKKHLKGKYFPLIHNHCILCKGAQINGREMV